MARQTCEGAWGIGIVGAIVVGLVTFTAWFGMLSSDGTSGLTDWGWTVVTGLSALTIFVLFAPWVICQLFSILRDAEK